MNSRIFVNLRGLCRMDGLLGALALMLLTSCSGGSSSPTPTPTPTATPQIAVSGMVVDGPVKGATLSAFAVSSSGVVATTALATTTTAADGSYTLMLPADTTGAVLITSSGGTFTDDVSGKTINAPPLSAIIPNIAGMTTVAAQLTPMTTLAAQLALATASSTNTIGSVAAAINTAIGGTFGGQANVLATPLVNVSTAGCATAAGQASVDASLVLAGLSQLAANNSVSTADLIQALVADLVTDNVLDGMASGVPLTVPLSGGTVMLCTIEGNCAGAPVTGLAQQLGAAILAYEKSGADGCGATESSAQQSTFAAAPPESHVDTPAKYSYTMNTSLSGYSGVSTVQMIMEIGFTCTDDGGGTTTSSPFHGSIATGSDGPVSFTATANGEYTESGYTFGYNAGNDCGTNTWTLKIVSPSDATCSISGASTGTFTTSNGGDINVAASPPTVTCSAIVASTYTVSANVTGLAAGESVTLQDSGGSAVSVASNTTTVLASGIAAGTAYAVSVTAQPSNETCMAAAGASGTVNANVTVNVTCSLNTVGGPPGKQTIYVIDSTYTLFAFDSQGNSIASVKLPGGPASVGNLNGGGIATDANNVYVTLGAPETGVAAFDRATLAPVTLTPGAFANVFVPRAIVLDPQNSQFYVANGGSDVTVYDSAGAASSSFNGTGIYGPSGIAYDPLDDAIWVANYTGGGSSTTPTYGIAEFTPAGSIMQNFPTANSNPPTPFAPPLNTGHEMPYSISYCGNVLIVGFISDGSNNGSSEAGTYSTAGKLLSTPYAGISNLHAIACGQNGSVFIAADNGLLEYNYATGASVTLPGAFAGLKAPIYGVGVGAGPGLNSPEGLVYSNGTLYVANSGSNQVLTYTVQTNTAGVVTGMTLSGSITADINDPVRLSLDTAGRLFVANLGNSTITAYDTTNGNAEITSAGKALISGGSLNKPLGVAVDAKENVYVADNGTASLSVFQPVTAGTVTGGYAEASFSPLSEDSAGNVFAAPGVLFDVNILGQDYLLLGLGPTTSPDSVILYQAPFTGAPTPIGEVSSVNNGVTCTSMPTGPTGIALILNTSNPLSSQIFVTSYYNSDVVEYLASSLIGSANTCPAPNAISAANATSLVSGPEGIAVDGTGTNVFVSNASSNTITVYGSGTALSGAPVFTLHN